jgi:MoaA/NifB/PqqE/SkfB family radical SAM enzyme
MTIDRMPILIVYPHSRCNCRCVMCDIWKRTDSLELTVENVEGWSADLRRLQVEEVVFSGGEPLMCSNLAGLAGAFRKADARLTLLTTGLLLEEKAAVAAAHFDSVIVSLDGPRAVHDRIRRVSGAYDRLAAGLRAVRAISPQMPAMARCTVQKLNHRALRATTQSARELGLDAISFLAVDASSEAFDHGPAAARMMRDRVGLTIEEVDALAAEVDLLISQEADSGFIRESPDKLRALVARFRSRLGLEPAQAPLCTAPWVSSVIETDGTVRPCFFHRPVGNAMQQGLMGAVNSGAAIRFRKELNVASNSTCQGCVCSLNRPLLAAPE